MREVWKQIEGFDNGYKVSNLGRVYSRKSRGMLTITTNINGYKTVKLSKRGGSTHKTKMVHRLVAKAFIPNPEKKKTVNHKNGIKSDNNLRNLEWMTLKENIRHAHKIGLCDNCTRRGADSHYAKLEKSDVLEIKELLKTSLTQKEIAEIYGVTHANISLIKLGKTWAHI